MPHYIKVGTTLEEVKLMASRETNQDWSKCRRHGCVDLQICSCSRSIEFSMTLLSRKSTKNIQDLISIKLYTLICSWTKIAKELKRTDLISSKWGPTLKFWRCSAPSSSIQWIEASLTHSKRLKKLCKMKRRSLPRSSKPLLRSFRCSN